MAIQGERGTTAASVCVTLGRRMGKLRASLAMLGICLILLVFAGKLYVADRGASRGTTGSLLGGRGSALETRDKKYVLVIDCGSSGTRMNAFEFDVQNVGMVTPSSSGTERGDGAGELNRGEAVRRDEGTRVGSPISVPRWIPSSAAPARLIPKRSTETRRAYQRVETEPGLSTYLRENRLHQVDERALQPLLTWAKAVVPRSQWKDTPVYLLGTAGLRRLSVEEQERVLGACREVLQRSPFMFESSQARVIDGKEEGLFGWAALNAAEGRLGVPGKEAETIGALDLGGSSLEVTYYVGDKGDSKTSQEVRVGGVTYRVQTTSYVGAGLDDAYGLALGNQSVLRNANGHPCLNRGYAGTRNDQTVQKRDKGRDKNNGANGEDSGAGNRNDGGEDYKRSTTRIEGAAFENGSNGPCYELADAVVGSLDISDSHSSTEKFAAMSGFYVINHFFGLDSSASLSDVQKATDEYCAMPWDSVLQRHKDELAVETYCFRGAYVMALLKELGVHDVILGYDDGRVGGWPMGFACLEMNGDRALHAGENHVVDGGHGRSNSRLALAMVVVLIVVALMLTTIRFGAGTGDPTNSFSNPFSYSAKSGRRTRVSSFASVGSSRSLEGMEEGGGGAGAVVLSGGIGGGVGKQSTVGGFTRSSTVSRKLNEISQ